MPHQVRHGFCCRCVRLKQRRLVLLEHVLHNLVELSLDVLNQARPAVPHLQSQVELCLSKRGPGSQFGWWESDSTVLRQLQLSMCSYSYST